MKFIHDRIDRYFPCPFERGGSLLVIVGVLSALAYVYSKIAFKHEFRDLPQNLMVLTFLISAWGQRRKIGSDPVFVLLLLALLIPWLLFGINMLIDYESAVKYRSTNDLLKLFLFLPLAWWIGGSREGVIRMLALAFLGLMTAVGLDPELSDSLRKLWSGQRVDFGIYNAQHVALFFGMALLFCVSSLAGKAGNGWKVNRGSTVIALIGLLGLIGLFATRTRAALIGLLIVGLFVVIIKVREGHLLGLSRAQRVKGMIVLTFVAGLIAWPAANIVAERFAAEKETIQALVAGNLDELPYQSTGIRVRSWVEASHWIAERPVTGWGQKARTDVIRLSESFPEDIKLIFGHLHNGYLEIAIGYGLVGIIFVCILWIVVLKRIRLAADRDIYAFTLYSAIFFLVLNLFESFFIYSSGEFVMALFFAAGYSQYLARNMNGELAGENPPEPP